MAIQLAPSRPDDRYVRMYYILARKGDEDNYWYEVEALSEDKADDKTGWIEYWSDDAKACKDSLKRIAGRLYVLTERKEKRSDEMEDDKAYEELQEYMQLQTEGLAFRTKAWRLVDSEGGEIEAPVTFENAKEVYSDENHDLRDKAQKFLKDRRNFPMRARAS